MNQPPLLGIQGPRFWAVLAAISGFGTLSSLLDVCLARTLHITDGWHQRFSVPALFITCLCSAVGLGTMWFGNFSDTGRLEIRGRLHSQEGMKLACSALYLLPWIYVFLVTSASTYRR